MAIITLSSPLAIPPKSPTVIATLTQQEPIPPRAPETVTELSEAMQIFTPLPQSKPTESIEFFLAQAPGWGDIKFDNDTLDLVKEEGIDTTLFLALFTDARAQDTDPLPNDNNDKRGWWGDELLGLETGSTMWLTTERGKLTTPNINSVKDSIKEAVQRQLVDTGIVDSVSIVTSTKVNGITWEITLHRQATDDIYLTYNQLWDGQIAKEIA